MFRYNLKGKGKKLKMDYVESQILEKKKYLTFLKGLIERYRGGVTGKVNMDMFKQVGFQVTTIDSDNQNKVTENNEDKELIYERELYELENQIAIIKNSVEYNVIVGKIDPLGIDLTYQFSNSGCLQSS